MFTSSHQWLESDPGLLMENINHRPTLLWPQGTHPTPSCVTLQQLHNQRCLELGCKVISHKPSGLRWKIPEKSKGYSGLALKYNIEFLGNVLFYGFLKTFCKLHLYYFQENITAIWISSIKHIRLQFIFNKIIADTSYHNNNNNNNNNDNNNNYSTGEPHMTTFWFHLALVLSESLFLPILFLH